MFINFAEKLLITVIIFAEKLLIAAKQTSNYMNKLWANKCNILTNQKDQFR